VDIRLQTAIIAAIVAVIVALLTPWAKNRFDKQARSEEWARKRDDWFLEKQARDTEEIVVAISNFLKILSSDIGQIHSLTNEVVISIIESPEPQQIDIEKPLSRFLINKWSVKTWFGYDSLRLSIWFETSKEVEGKLAELGTQFEALYTVLDHRAHMLQGFSTTSEAQDPGSYDRAVNFINRMQEDIKHQSQRLLESAASIQRELVDSLRKV